VPPALRSDTYLFGIVFGTSFPDNSWLQRRSNKENEIDQALRDDSLCFRTSVAIFLMRFASNVFDNWVFRWFGGGTSGSRKIEALRSFEIPMKFCQTSRRHVQHDRTFHTERRENLNLITQLRENLLRCNWREISLSSHFIPYNGLLHEI
jgi:hypothetical protein